MRGCAKPRGACASRCAAWRCSAAPDLPTCYCFRVSKILVFLDPENEQVHLGDIPAETFCDIHVIEQVPNEQRFIAAYYSQGVKIVDYFVDSQGHVQFRETSSFTLPNANTWAAEDFKIVNNADGTRTYFIAADDIHRGIDVMSWTGRPNPIGAFAPMGSSATAAMNVGLLGLAALLLPAAAAFGRRRRRAVR